jgi:4-hydroxy-2-oxoheptanedioate aldolase
MGAHLKALLSQDRLIKVFVLGQLCNPKLVEMVAWQGGFDAVWLDQEHVGLTIPQIEEAARAARACGLDSFVRLTATDYATVMRALEAGAGGVMAAMVRSVREVEDLVNWAKFHPRGQRGLNGSGIDGRYGTLPLAEYLRRSNAETVVGVQIEHVDAVEEVEKIAAVADVDFLLIGPADLSQSMGLPGEWDHPRMWQAIERVARASRANRIPWAILPPNAVHARRCVELGCRMLTIGVDSWVFNLGVKAFKERFAEFFPG